MVLQLSSPVSQTQNTIRSAAPLTSPPPPPPVLPCPRVTKQIPLLEGGRLMLKYEVTGNTVGAVGVTGPWPGLCPSATRATCLSASPPASTTRLSVSLSNAAPLSLSKRYPLCSLWVTRYHLGPSFSVLRFPQTPTSGRTRAGTFPRAARILWSRFCAAVESVHAKVPPRCVFLLDPLAIRSAFPCPPPRLSFF